MTSGLNLSAIVSACNAVVNYLSLLQRHLVQKDCLPERNCPALGGRRSAAPTRISL